MVLGNSAPPAGGFVSFCEREPRECGASTAELAEMERTRSLVNPGMAVSSITFDWSKVFPQNGPAQATFADDTFHRPVSGVMHMTSAVWSLINHTNERINRAIVARADVRTYGVDDYWATPLESGVRYGDCEDYVLEKRHALLAAGFAPRDLSIALVTAQRGEAHAVLLVTTDAGEYVLDNLSPWIVPWTETGYVWRKRQVAGSPSNWAFITNGSAQPDAFSKAAAIARAFQIAAR
jgi:predicted transglutaminase-like cysteine proteinase